MRPLALALLFALAVAVGAQPPASPPSPGSVRVLPQTRVPLPLQPFTIELLDLKRGEWKFADAFGQNVSLDGDVEAFVYGGSGDAPIELAYLSCDPEFPDDPAHAVLKAVPPSQMSPKSSSFRIDEPALSASVEVSAPVNGAWACRLHDVRLGPAAPEDRYVAAVYLLQRGVAHPLWLAPGASGLRLLTDRVGNVFSEGEPVRVTLASVRPTSATRRIVVEARDLSRGDTVWRGVAIVLPGAPGSATCGIPLHRFGVFVVSAHVAGSPDSAIVRVCRIPRRQPGSPDASGIGINLFQQQIWWYAYQAPLMAKAGVHWIRPWLAWENTWSFQQPSPNRWVTQPLDAALRRMDRFGLRYQDILYSAPAWALGGAPGQAPPLDRMDIWSHYVETLARRYRGRIPCYEIWNEPDIMWPEATRHSGAHYVALLKSAYAAIRRADPHARVLGLSHAGYEEWLDHVASLGAGRWMDVATIHTYAKPGAFLSEVQRRKDILRRHGMASKPVWVNEFGATADDLNAAYSLEYHCSERLQAELLVENYAQALSVSTGTKAFWFCTLDPRDPAHRSQWTEDAGIGVLYLGLLPKLAYAALAGVAKELDYRACSGVYEGAGGLHVVSFSGPVAVVWRDRSASQAPILATRIGCAPDEHVVVRDLLANPIAAGRAADVRIDPGAGPLFVEGSRQLDAIVRAEAAGAPDTREVVLQREPASKPIVVLHVPATAAARVTVQAPPGLPVTTRVRRSASRNAWEISLAPPAGTRRIHGALRVTTHFAPGAFGLRTARNVIRRIAVTIGEPDLIRDGGFDAGSAEEWSPERTSAYTWDPVVGHSEPGSLRLDAPFDRRLVHWRITPTAARPLKLRCWIRSDRLSGCRASISLALFSRDNWLTTWCLASTDPLNDMGPASHLVAHCARIPTGTAAWTCVEASMRPAEIPADVDHAALLIDVTGGGSGRLWLDDIDLWQPKRSSGE